MEAPARYDCKRINGPFWEVSKRNDCGSFGGLVRPFFLSWLVDARTAWRNRRVILSNGAPGADDPHLIMYV
jgi:hypothetical protein